MAGTQPVNFRVLSICKGEKENFVVIKIVFDNSVKEYTYCRKYGRDGFNLFAIISGCKITFDKDFNFISVEREYDVKGIRRRTTSSPRRKRFKLPEMTFKDLEQDSEPEETTWEKPEEEPEEEQQDEEPKKDEEPEEEEFKLPKKIRHEEYQTICDCLDADIPIYLVGPAGSGKNYTLEQEKEDGIFTLQTLYSKSTS